METALSASPPAAIRRRRLLAAQPPPRHLAGVGWYIWGQSVNESVTPRMPNRYQTGAYERAANDFYPTPSWVTELLTNTCGCAAWSGSRAPARARWQQ